MDAYDRSEQLMMEIENRYVTVYNAALVKAIRNVRGFLQKVRDVESGKIQPPQYYVDRDEVGKWREGFLRELMQKLRVVESIQTELDKAGGNASGIIKEGLDEVYKVNRDETVRTFSDELQGRRARSRPVFEGMSKREIRIAIEDAQPVFSKIAYQNLGNNQVARRRLQNSLAEALALGEGQDKILRRIRRIAAMEMYQARRIAQTECTRVRSQARYEAGQEASRKGVGVYYEWSTRMRNSRETHVQLDGQKRMQGEAFETIKQTKSGNSTVRLLYPGDPSAPASEVINCFCVLIPHVLLPSEKLVDGEVVKRGG